MAHASDQQQPPHSTSGVGLGKMRCHTNRAGTHAQTLYTCMPEHSRAHDHAEAGISNRCVLVQLESADHVR
eukprot:14506485-Alexandrium_andersonii.AAC.1